MFRAPVFSPGASFPGRPRNAFTRAELEAELREAGFVPAAFWRWGGFGAIVGISQASAVSTDASPAAVQRTGTISR
jgi:hypothetical protein